ncbi:hypothetical protein BDZ91DRAFT_715382 [Kalaharituber pfeilii]|nr:hypothetical protein BDZ91DRAFT_715382 [Kalaharituber pfeilii]
MWQLGNDNTILIIHKNISTKALHSALFLCVSYPRLLFSTPPPRSHDEKQCTTIVMIFMITLLFYTKITEDMEEFLFLIS